MSDVPGDMADLIASAEKAIHAVLVNPAVWSSEAGRVDAPPLPWPPLVDPKDGYNQLLRNFVVAAATRAIEALNFAHQISPPLMLPSDGNSPAFQEILRVCARAVDAAKAVLDVEYAKVSRITGQQIFWNWFKRRRVSEILNAGGTVEEAAGILGIRKSSAYRALGRKNLRGK